jgi:hypothetical protein
MTPLSTKAAMTAEDLFLDAEHRSPAFRIESGQIAIICRRVIKEGSAHLDDRADADMRALRRRPIPRIADNPHMRFMPPVF